ncbi:alcohol dehydrogenase [Dactylonectria estremocensis]|uniref:Alcohol dehydrogenase n=1 Tax=Dactylonectria estremocensis TaxID=1079267 RepID=A0A9P9EV08_9HYPO|nr:alcohol dehydrogenase [Dactylonectria estremocensis]
MALPATYAAFRRTVGDLPRSIEFSSESLPRDLGPREVLIKIHAVSLNFRDLAMLHGRYPVQTEERGIPCSDCAAEVVAIGSAVEDFAIGDRVSPIFDVTNFTGNESTPPIALGGDIPGVLREYAVFEDRVLVHLPKYLTWEEASTLTCAGVTAWVALNSPSSVSGHTSALLQGTGGVSMFALVICIAAGIKPIITSSSDAKLEFIKELSPEVYGINRNTQDQASEVLRATDGAGVDIVINNSGPASIPDDLKLLRLRGGTVSLVGFLDGLTVDWEPTAMTALIGRAARLQGIEVGSKVDYQHLNAYLEKKKVSIAPIIDRTFSFQDSKAAFDYMYSGKHTGKVVIKL